ncbi:metallophosphoesterase [Tepidicella xavieri]|jgi:predicted phosphodiesterase|uniref:Calcineurin-like phosphoesterase family protein n=1 Tax=Tepidicella xavieri TaxID=360241 RepID=A0A4R6U827_9BURK|nr:metallophosphoesterase [Tepidicella xavieri]TDQ42531.1 calcineurin-like phosphoesterase family protein [Tepidicella xavieri]
MRIQLLSDLHLEANPGFCPVVAPGADVLVLAGDIGSYQRRPDGAQMAEPDWGLQRFSPLPQYAGWPTPVLFCPGNHEYDGLDFDDAHRRLRATCERLGIVWLERATHVLAGVRFIGTTLWSDFDALAQVPHAGRGLPAEPQARAVKLRERAFRAANFHLTRMQTQRHGRLFDAQAVREEALAAQDWLRTALEQPHPGPTVVVTHFAPSLRSQDPRYGINPGTAGFCNALDDWLALADVWLHGHLHCRQDYRLHGCRVVANPLGYADKAEQEGFDPVCVVEVDDRAVLGCA